MTLLRRRRRRKLPAVARVSLCVPEEPNERFSMNFIHDQLTIGRRLRCLTLVDDFRRQCLAIYLDTSAGPRRRRSATSALSRQLPKTISVAEFAYKLSTSSLRVLSSYRAWEPMQNASIESLNSTFPRLPQSTLV
jgi:putative transposase